MTDADPIHPASIRNIRSATAAEWDAAWHACSYATYFHSRYWSELWHHYEPRRYRPQPLHITFDDGKTAILPFSAQSILYGLATRILSSPAGTYGGWISANDLGEQHVAAICDAVSNLCPNLIWRHNPYTPSTFAPDGAIKADQTQVLDLTQIDGAATALQSRGHRSATSKAIRNGIVISRAQTPSEWQEYFHMYQSSLTRWGSSATNHYRFRLFKLLRESSLEHGYIDLWLAKYHGEIAAGALCVLSMSCANYWHGATLKKHSSKRPANLLFTTIIENYKNAEKRWFDFNPSGGHEGVSIFKRRFGTQTLLCRIISRSSMPITIARTILRR